MGPAFRQNDLLNYIDLALYTKNYSSIPKELEDKAFCHGADPKEVIQKLKMAHVLYIHPDGFDIWTDILFYLAEKMSLPLRLVIIAGSDYALGDEHMEPFLAFFPNTEFWITNWCGSFERCKLLPLGVMGQANGVLSKTKPLCISFLLNYIGNEKREEFYYFLKKNPDFFEAYALPSLNYQDYTKAVSECYFSTCPMGEGFDTFRFWESLMVGAIPIVKDHPFYDTLAEQYPTLPFLRIQTWDELPSLIPTLTEEKWQALWGNNRNVCTQRYWIEQLEWQKSQR